MPFSQDPSGWDGAVRAETVGEPDPAELSTKVVSPDPDELSKSLDIYVDNDIEIIKLYSGMSALGATFLLREAKKRGIVAVADLWQLNMDADWMKMTGLDGWAHSSPFAVTEEANKWMAAMTDSPSSPQTSARKCQVYGSKTMATTRASSKTL